MPYTLSSRESISLAGDTVDTRSSVSADVQIAARPPVAPAKTGTLSTRTDNDTGTLTMAGGHGITTGARLDIYWTGGSRRGVTVGTVATNSVPFDGGAGDNLPIATTPITAMVPVEEPLPATGNDVVGILIASDVYGTIVLADGSDEELLVKQIGGSANDAEKAYAWYAARDPVNPIAGDTVAKVFFSHGSSTLTADMRAALLVD